MDKANDFLVDMVIAKLSDLLAGFQAIDSSESPCEKLNKDELL